MERPHLPLADVAAAGGWRDIATVLRCYAQADRRTMLGVMSVEHKLTTKDGIAGRSQHAMPALQRVANKE